VAENVRPLAETTKGIAAELKGASDEIKDEVSKFIKNVPTEGERAKLAAEVLRNLKKDRSRCLDSNKKYRVVPPNDLYKGKSYTDWISDWCNWLFSLHPDEHNDGPVVFLKQAPPLGGEKTTSNPYFILDDEGHRIYRNDPNVMIGEKRLEISENQAILVPVLMSYWSATEPDEDDVSLRNRVRNHTSDGDDPPYRKQLTIDGDEIQLEEGFTMSDYRIETPVFPLIIPESEYGTTYKDYVDTPFMESGTFPTISIGYFFLIECLRAGDYIIHSYGRGSPTKHGPYFAELLYQLKVRNRKLGELPPQAGTIPENITQRLHKKIKRRKDELSEGELEDLIRIVKESRESQKNAVFKRSVTGSSIDSIR
jgi:hypothetical protein